MPSVASLQTSIINRTSKIMKKITEALMGAFISILGVVVCSVIFMRTGATVAVMFGVGAFILFLASVAHGLDDTKIGDRLARFFE